MYVHNKTCVFLDNPRATAGRRQIVERGLSGVFSHVFSLLLSRLVLSLVLSFTSVLSMYSQDVSPSTAGELLVVSV